MVGTAHVNLIVMFLKTCLQILATEQRLKIAQTLLQ